MRIAVAALLGAFVLAPSAASRARQPARVTRQTTLEAQLAQQINAVRRSYGLKPLTVSAKLSSAARRAHARDGRRRLLRARVLRLDAVLEARRALVSVARLAQLVGRREPPLPLARRHAESGVEMWMNSPPHRANLLSRSWREIGISAIHFDAAPGEYDGAPVTIVTADFGAARLSRASAAPGTGSRRESCRCP